MVESGLRNGGTRFVTGTFTFLQVCRHWNEVAIGSPRLWGWWVPGAVRAWPLFHSRSKDAPLFLTWQYKHKPLPTSVRDILMDPSIPGRVRRLDLSGTSQQLIQFFDGFGSTSSSNVSSIRLEVWISCGRQQKEYLACFFSSCFPQLSQLDPEDFRHISSSPIFTTSGLFSLKLSLPCTRETPFSLSQFSQTLQQHPNLDFESATPLPGPSGTSSAPFVHPRLVGLRLGVGSTATLVFTDLVGMSSPPHDVAMRFGPTDIATIPRLVNAMKEILVQYYERKGLIHPRKVNHLAISYNSISYKPGGLCIVINSRSHSTPRSNLRFQFEWTNERERDIVVKEGFPPFLLDDVREFAVECSVINKDEYRGMFQKMKNLSHLELDELNIQLVLDVLSTDNHDGQQPIPRLESLTLSYLCILPDYTQVLLDIFKERRDHNVGPQKLVFRSCRVCQVEYLKLKLREVVNKVKWDNLYVPGPHSTCLHL